MGIFQILAIGKNSLGLLASFSKLLSCRTSLEMTFWCGYMLGALTVISLFTNSYCFRPEQAPGPDRVSGWSEGALAPIECL